MQNCPEVEKNVHSIKNIQHIETGQWFKGSNVSNPINDIEDYDIESCVEYENFNFQLADISQNQNHFSNDCLDLIKQSAREDDENQNTSLILSTTIPSMATLGFLIAILMTLVKKRLICKEKKANENVIVHQNDLYGNLTNQEYFDQRYDTNVTDTNQYYYGEDEDR